VLGQPVELRHEIVARTTLTRRRDPSAKSGIIGSIPRKAAEMSDEAMADKAAQAGRTAGTFAGMLSGARLGNMAIPVPFLGTFVGGVVGGVVGNEVGQRLGRAVINGASSFWTTLTTPSIPADPTA
jgi:hypothetical protein